MQWTSVYHILLLNQRDKLNKMKTLKEILNWIPVIFTIIPFIIETELLISALIILGVLFWFLYYIVFLKKLFFQRGVFAVASIIIDDENKILLINDNGFYKQPGSFYRTNTLMFNSSLETPFTKIVSTIKKETGLSWSDIELIDLSYFGHQDEVSVKSVLKTKKEEKFFEDCLRHRIVPPPFYILKEIGGTKSSKEPYHITSYYAFRVVNKTSAYESVEWKTIPEFKELKNSYKDLSFIIDKLIFIYKLTNFPKLNIRLCRFNNKNQTLLWRLNNDCNASCDYCIVKTKKTNECRNLSVNVDNIVKDINSSGVNKVVISGGEPFLVKNLDEILSAIDKSAVKKISICTNGINYNNQLSLFEDVKDNKYKKFDKFVVNLDSCNVTEFKKIKGLNGNQDIAYNNALKFINECVVNSISFTINIVGHTYFLNNIEEYVSFWKENGIKKITISSPVGGEYSFKSLLLDKYQKILEGKYGDVSFFEEIELNLPICEEKGCINTRNIFTIDEDGTYYDDCLDAHLPNTQYKTAGV